MFFSRLRVTPGLSVCKHDNNIVIGEIILQTYIPDKHVLWRDLDLSLSINGAETILQGILMVCKMVSSYHWYFHKLRGCRGTWLLISKTPAAIFSRFESPFLRVPAQTMKCFRYLRYNSGWLSWRFSMIPSCFPVITLPLAYECTVLWCLTVFETAIKERYIRIQNINR